MNWGKGIIVSFVMFAAFIGALLFACLREDVSLVSADYYKMELEYEGQIVRINNTRKLAEKPRLEVAGDSLLLHYAELPRVTAGELVLFRPSDARLDKTFRFHATGGGVMSFNLGSLPSGMYKARLSWTADGKEYFMEEVVQL